MMCWSFVGCLCLMCMWPKDHFPRRLYPGKEAEEVNRAKGLEKETGTTSALCWPLAGADLMCWKLFLILEVSALPLSHLAWVLTPTGPWASLPALILPFPKFPPIHTWSPNCLQSWWAGRRRQNLHRPEKEITEITVMEFNIKDC